MILFLSGYRGTGKTGVAQLLSNRLGWPWFDTDAEIQLRSGITIAEIFEQQGEETFRSLEAEVIADLTGKEQAIVALGGGALMRQENRNAIAGRGKVVWLSASATTIADRLAGDPATAPQRPNLTAAGGLQEITELLAARTPIYRQSADYQVDTDKKTPDEVADLIVTLLGAWLGRQPGEAGS